MKVRLRDGRIGKLLETMKPEQPDGWVYVYINDPRYGGGGTGVLVSASPCFLEEVVDEGGK